ncbi:MAG: YihY/virulence factor BrkB family protein [Muribaculaceae bacterium]|nr:YihY/virulence factor BrkB family protein [Muribaculaceae bacterium]
MNATKGNRLTRLIDYLRAKWSYCSVGVWQDTRHRWSVNLIKTVNLSVRSFMDRDLQSQAAAMTFKTVLAIVPALAMLFAIGRGFGMQEILQSQLFTYFPAQREALTTAFQFVESYLANTSGGLFVGIGVAFLLYTLISLLDSVEGSFNKIWGIKRGRSFFRKITDYTAILLILPILLLCSSGITILMSTTLESALPSRLAPAAAWLVEIAGIVVLWIFYTGVYMLVPNTRVKFKNALIAGILAGTAFAILQWLFVSGQLYVTKYNAIYGSVAFLPLLLIWLQLVWLITLAGGVLCYASQSIYEFSFSADIAHIALDYRRKIIISVYKVIIDNFMARQKPIDEVSIASGYGIPISLVTRAVNELTDTGLVNRVIITDDQRRPASSGLAPALDPSEITLGLVLRRMRKSGASDFIPEFNQNFAPLIADIDSVEASTYEAADKILLKDIPAGQSR